MYLFIKAVLRTENSLYVLAAVTGIPDISENSDKFHGYHFNVPGKLQCSWREGTVSFYISGI